MTPDTDLKKKGHHIDVVVCLFVCLHAISSIEVTVCVCLSPFLLPFTTVADSWLGGWGLEFMFECRYY